VRRKPAPKSLIELLVPGFYGIPTEAPEWARRAAKMVFACVMPKRTKHNASEEYKVGFGCGRLSGEVELRGLKHQLAQDLIRSQRQHAAELPPEKAADFFTGLRDGEKFMRELQDRAKEMVQRAKIFRAIAVRWKEVAPGKLNSTGELYEWLRSQKVIVPGTDSREIRKVCKIIGLRYSDQ